MRLFLLFAVLLSGCSGPVLKRCEHPVVDHSVMACKEQVSGVYWKCVPAKDLRVCQDPL